MISKSLVDQKFDFSTLFAAQDGIKDHFRRLKRSEHRFQKQLSKSHNKFFQQILYNKRISDESSASMSFHPLEAEKIHK